MLLNCIDVHFFYTVGLHVISIFFFFFFKYCDTWVAPAIAAQIVPPPDIILLLYILYYDYWCQINKFLPSFLPSCDREINLISLAHFDSGAYISRVQSALKVKILHQYAWFWHVLMCNDWMNAFMDKKWS